MGIAESGDPLSFFRYFIIFYSISLNCREKSTTANYAAAVAINCNAAGENQWQM